MAAGGETARLGMSGWRQGRDLGAGVKLHRWTREPASGRARFRRGIPRKHVDGHGGGTARMSDGPYIYDYPRPMVTVDTVVFAPHGQGLAVLLIQRGKAPFEGHWALPGGFVDMEEDLAAAAARELEEETGVAGVTLDQFRTYGAPGRDPRGRTISVVHLALVDSRRHPVSGGSDAAKAAWWDIWTAPPMAFDHGTIVSEARFHLQELTRHAGVGVQALESPFPFDALLELYERIWGASIAEDPLRAQLLDLEIIEPDAWGRPGHYTFVSRHQARV